jgi:hypothetical protein
MTPPNPQRPDAFTWVEDVADIIVDHPVLIDMFQAAIRRAQAQLEELKQQVNEPGNE